jgi:hypothetical protein
MQNPGHWPIHVARVWPPRKDDFRKSQAGLRSAAAITSFTAGSKSKRFNLQLSWSAGWRN